MVGPPLGTFRGAGFLLGFWWVLFVRALGRSSGGASVQVPHSSATSHSAHLILVAFSPGQNGECSALPARCPAAV